MPENEGKNTKLGFAALLARAADQQEEEKNTAEAELFDDPAAEAPAKRGRGRPAGRINRATELQARAVLASGLSPMSFLLSVMRDDNQKLDRRIGAATALLPYLYKKQPMAIDLEAKGGMILQIDLGAESVKLSSGGEGESEKNKLIDISAPDANLVENQPLSESKREEV